MAITFQKRQKEMKRLEKQRAKAERREQRKLVKRTGTGPEIEEAVTTEDVTTPPEPAPEN